MRVSDSGHGRPPVLVLGMIAISLAFGAAQDQQDQQTRPPFRTEANYIRVDMYPMRDGAPVTDLRQEEVEILDEGVVQKVDRFEHVLLQGVRSQQVRRDPTTVDEARQAAQDIRARLFVLFLDTKHVDGSSSRQISRPLAGALNALIGGDDLIAVMTPDMSARDLTFTRRITTIEALLQTRWGTRDQSIMLSDVEEQYATCYPAIPPDPRALASDRGIAQEMILRRREVKTLDALEELVQHLGTVREERKAVIAISNGWRLYGENATLRRPLDNPAPPMMPVMVDPRTGRPTTAPEAPYLGLATPSCERARTELSMLDHERRFQNILNEANRANASFYPIDPRGVVVFDEDIVPVAGVGTGRNANPMVGLQEDSARLSARNASLRTLAEATDGLAIVETGNILAGLKRMSDDLSSYYLLGYYSTQKLDGRFHRITVRIKRPGVQVRARRGYLAASVSSTSTSSSAARGTSTPASTRSAEARAVDAPLASLAPLARERPLRVQAAAAWTAAGLATFWAVAEVQGPSAQSEWSTGGQITATLVDGTGATVATEVFAVQPGSVILRLVLTPRAPITSGDYQLQIRAKGAGPGLAATESVRMSLPPAPDGYGALFTKRGITTGNKEVPTADLRFRRTDRIVVEVPASSSDAGSARLLDRVGQTLSVPVTTAIREDADGSRWRTAQLTLAPLAPGDYIVDVTAGTEHTLTAFRVLP